MGWVNHHISFITNTVPARIVEAATILGFGLFGAATIQTESTIQISESTIIPIFILDPKNIHFFTKKIHF